MNKEITCRLVDGKPVVEYKEEYVPKKGDIVVSGYTTKEDKTSYWISVYDRCRDGFGYYYQAKLLILDKDSASCILQFDNYCDAQTYTRQATPEESEVMHHILNENGYKLVGDTVVKKRWVPKMREEYWYLEDENGIFKPECNNRTCPDDLRYVFVFKTKQACQAACDKLNEYALTLPQ